MNSSRHHFIPQFYLRQFTDSDGKFFIYDVWKDTFRGSGRKFTPKQQFYESFANTMFYFDDSSDFIEKHYAIVDTKVGNILDKLSSASNDLTRDEWLYLQYFVNIMYWRLPVNEEKVKIRIQDASHLREFGLKLMNKETGERLNDEEHEKLLRKLKTDKEFYKNLKFMIPALTYHETFQKAVNNYAHIFNFDFPNPLPKLVSDNPIIYRNPEKASLHIDDFIFPLTPTKLLFRHSYSKLKIWSEVRVMIDALLLMQAYKYISCTDMVYPKLLRKLVESQYESIGQLREEIFAKILDGSS